MPPREQQFCLFSGPKEKTLPKVSPSNMAKIDFLANVLPEETDNILAIGSWALLAHLAGKLGAAPGSWSSNQKQHVGSLPVLKRVGVRAEMQRVAHNGGDSRFLRPA